MDIQRITLAEQPYLYVERETVMGPEIAQAMESGFGEIFTWTEENGIERQSMPIAVYVDMPSGPSMRFRLGFYVSAEDAAKASGNVKAATIPAGDAVKAVHVGDYASLNQTHQAVWNHMDSLGAENAMPVWEVYVDDPTLVPPAEVRTEVYRSIG